MGLPPLRWVAEENLIYDSATNTLHRPGCPHAGTVTSPRPVPAHGALQLVWAPTLCDCQPDVTLALSHTDARSGRDVSRVDRGAETHGQPGRGRWSCAAVRGAWRSRRCRQP